MDICRRAKQKNKPLQVLGYTVSVLTLNSNMPKNRTMASYILTHDLDIHTSDIILKHFLMYSNHPDAEKFKVSDVHNGLKLIKNGFTLGQDEETGQPTKRKRSNPLKRGSMIDFAKCIADEGDRFSPNEKALILQTLKASWAITLDDLI